MEGNDHDGKRGLDQKTLEETLGRVVFKEAWRNGQYYIFGEVILGHGRVLASKPGEELVLTEEMKAEARAEVLKEFRRVLGRNYGMYDENYFGD